MVKLSILCLLALLVAAPAHGSKGQLNPITRVVQLLEGLAEKVEEDGKKEEDLFEKYVCWYKTVVKTKTASNAAAKDRIESLTAYIDDVESGRIEFTSERADLEKKLGELNKELEEAKDLRDKEHEDFLAAKDEMKKAIAALEKAIDVLNEGTKSGLMSTGFDVEKVLELSRSGMMSEKDVRFLERALEEQIPSIDGKGKDWKKLNRKATFKMKYKARSGKIQGLLADMLQTFKDNLADARKKEKEAKATYDELKGAKEDEKNAAQDGLTDSEKENAARDLALQESKDELENLNTQVENDEKYIAETEEAYKAQLENYKARKTTRAEEIAAINKAIAVLRSDDARDTFKKSFASQGYLFLQEESEEACSPAHRQKKALALVKTVSHHTKSVRLAALALDMKMRMSTGGAFDKVLTMIDDMLKTLEEEGEADLKKKEECEKDRMEQTKKAKDLSQEIDEKSEFIERKQALIEELKTNIEDAKKEIEDLELQLREATDQRNAEKKEYELSRADDEAAVELISKAMEVLEGFYGDKGAAALVQKRQKREPGEAPPPPPSMPEGPYEGATGEANGIIAILEMIKNDVEKDIKEAEEEEKKAQEEYDKFKETTEESISNLQAAIVDYENQISDAESAVADSETQRADLKKLLEETMKLLKDMAPGCDFIAVNFELRKKNRQAEKDGLEKAKAILKGASTGGFLQQSGC